MAHPANWLLPALLVLFMSAWSVAIPAQAQEKQTISVSVPVGAIGKINQAGLWKRSNCTGTLIAPDKVLTAAHCLRNETTGEVYPSDTLHFLPGFNKGAYLAHGRVASISFAGPVPPEGASAEKRLVTDAAVITLTEPMKIEYPALSDPTSVPQIVLHAGYMKRDPDSLTLSGPCAVKPLDNGVWISNCHAETGSSGGPILQIGPDGVGLAGIVVAVDNQGSSFVIPLALIQDLVSGALADETTDALPASAN